jgi:hypothetical protein
MSQLIVPEIEQTGFGESITLNGVKFTPVMLETLREWYPGGLAGDSLPDYFIRDLVSIQGYFIEQLGASDEKNRDLICRFLTKTRWLIENLQPFQRKEESNDNDALPH